MLSEDVTLTEAEDTAIFRAIEAAVNFHGFDARLEMADFDVAAAIMETTTAASAPGGIVAAVESIITARVCDLEAELVEAKRNWRYWQLEHRAVAARAADAEKRVREAEAQAQSFLNAATEYPETVIEMGREMTRLSDKLKDAEAAAADAAAQALQDAADDTENEFLGWHMAQKWLHERAKAYRQVRLNCSPAEHTEDGFCVGQCRRTVASDRQEAPNE